MPKKVVFEFDENSKISIAELKALGFTFREIPLGDGRVVIIPVEPHPTVCGADGDYCPRFDPGGTYIIGEQRYCWDCHRPRSSH